MIQVTTDSHLLNMVLSISLILFRRVDRLKQGAAEKTMRCGFNIEATVTKRIYSILKA